MSNGKWQDLTMFVRATVTWAMITIFMPVFIVGMLLALAAFCFMTVMTEESFFDYIKGFFEKFSKGGSKKKSSGNSGSGGGKKEGESEKEYRKRILKERLIKEGKWDEENDRPKTAGNYDNGNKGGQRGGGRNKGKKGRGNQKGNSQGARSKNEL